MSLKKIKPISKEITPFLIAILLSSFLRNEIIVTIIFAVIILTLFLTRYKKKELLIFIFGFLTGLFIEIWGQLVGFFQWQTFNSILLIPLWLPLSWGYSFVVIRRIGNILIKNGNK